MRLDTSLALMVLVAATANANPIEHLQRRTSFPDLVPTSTVDIATDSTASTQPLDGATKTPATATKTRGTAETTQIHTKRHQHQHHTKQYEENHPVQSKSLGPWTEGNSLERYSNADPDISPLWKTFKLDSKYHRLSSVHESQSGEQPSSVASASPADSYTDIPQRSQIITASTHHRSGAGTISTTSETSGPATSTSSILGYPPSHTSKPSHHPEPSTGSSSTHTSSSPTNPSSLSSSSSSSKSSKMHGHAPSTGYTAPHSPAPTHPSTSGLKVECESGRDFISCKWPYMTEENEMMVEAARAAIDLVKVIGETIEVTAD